MQSIRVHRYPDPKAIGWAGYIEPEDRAWIAFVGLDGVPRFFLQRDPASGAVLPDDSAEREEAIGELRKEEARRAGWEKPDRGVHFPAFAGEPFSTIGPLPPAVGAAVNAEGETANVTDGKPPPGFALDGMLVSARLGSLALSL